MEVEEEDKYKTAFTPHYGLYQFLRVPLALKNSPGTFQRVVDVISMVKCKHMLSYLKILNLPHQDSGRAHKTRFLGVKIYI